MMNKSYALSVILSLAGLLMATDGLQARGHRGGCHGGCYSSCYSSCHGCYGGCYSSCHGCYGGCYGYHGCHSYYSHCGGCYGGCYGCGSYGGGYGGGYVYGSSYGSSVPYASSGSISNQSHPVPVASTNAATVRVILPSSQGSVWVDGNQTTSTGAVRVFQTPELTTAGTYRIKASWTVDGREVTNERNVRVSSGQTSVVDFSQTSTEVATRP